MNNVPYNIREFRICVLMCILLPLSLPFCHKKKVLIEECCQKGRILFYTGLIPFQVFFLQLYYQNNTKNIFLNILQTVAQYIFKGLLSAFILRVPYHYIIISLDYQFGNNWANSRQKIFKTNFNSINMWLLYSRYYESLLAHQSSLFS